MRNLVATYWFSHAFFVTFATVRLRAENIHIKPRSCKSSSKDIDTTENYILYSDLCRQLKNALEQLPPQEREVFEMSRLENIKYQEIANRLNISVRTVEVRISKALKQLRILLKDFYLLLFLFLFH